jgi:hypothetical protein
MGQAIFESENRIMKKMKLPFLNLYLVKESDLKIFENQRQSEIQEQKKKSFLDNKLILNCLESETNLRRRLARYEK